MPPKKRPTLTPKRKKQASAPAAPSKRKKQPATTTATSTHTVTQQVTTVTTVVSSRQTAPRSTPPPAKTIAKPKRKPKSTPKPSPPAPAAPPPPPRWHVTRETGSERETVGAYADQGTAIGIAKRLVGKVCGLPYASVAQSRYLRVLADSAHSWDVLWTPPTGPPSRVTVASAAFDAAAAPPYAGKRAAVGKAPKDEKPLPGASDSRVRSKQTARKTGAATSPKVKAAVRQSAGGKRAASATAKTPGTGMAGGGTVWVVTKEAGYYPDGFHAPMPPRNATVGVFGSYAAAVETAKNEVGKDCGWPWSDVERSGHLEVLRDSGDVWEVCRAPPGSEYCRVKVAGTDMVNGTGSAATGRQQAAKAEKKAAKGSSKASKPTAGVNRLARKSGVVKRPAVKAEVKRATAVSRAGSQAARSSAAGANATSMKRTARKSGATQARSAADLDDDGDDEGEPEDGFFCMF